MSAVPVAAEELREADRPPEERGLSRDRVLMLVADPAAGGLYHGHFDELPELLGPGDVLVLNTSRTLPAALPARSAGGVRLLLHLSTPAPGERPGRWIVELRTDDGRHHGGHAGQRLLLPGGAEAELLASYVGSRLWVADLHLGGRDLLDYLDSHGQPIRYGHARADWPLDAYQNVYAVEPGSAEMPSAGRPFTAGMITRLVARGVDVAPVVLHTGVSSLERGEPPYSERFEVSRATAERVNLARALGGRVVAVGTTSVLALESAAHADGSVRSAASTIATPRICSCSRRWPDRRSSRVPTPPRWSTATCATSSATCCSCCRGAASDLALAPALARARPLGHRLRLGRLRLLRLRRPEQ